MNEPFDCTVEGSVRPLPNRVLVCDMEYGDKLTKGGLIILNDDGKERGIKPRWATVYAVGEQVTDVKVGDRIMIAHGRWTRGVQVVDAHGSAKVVRMVEEDSIMGVDES